MLIDAIKAVVFAGFPVGLFSFLMIYYAYSKSYISTEIEIKHAFKNPNEEHSTLSKKHKKSLLFLHSKWVSFGGGFYGLVALLTFIYIELSQVINFLFSIRGWHDISALFTVNALIAMFIDSIINMVKSAIWFTYWPSEVDSSNFLLWILIAYVGYRLGAKYARYYVINQRAIKEDVEDAS